MDRGAWWAAIYGVAQSRTRLKQLSSSSSSRDLGKGCSNHLMEHYVSNLAVKTISDTKLFLVKVCVVFFFFFKQAIRQNLE